MFTAVLARRWYHETLDGRVSLAMALLTLGGMVLVLDRADVGGRAQLPGLLAVLPATAAWGVDNTLSRALAERDPGQVVLVKAALDSLGHRVAGILFRDPLPYRRGSSALLAIGASGYGLSLRFYLLAQRAFAAARIVPAFAFARFVGAPFAFALGERSGSAWMLREGRRRWSRASCLTRRSDTPTNMRTRRWSNEHAHSHDVVVPRHDHRHDPMPMDSTATGTGMSHSGMLIRMCRMTSRAPTLRGSHLLEPTRAYRVVQGAPVKSRVGSGGPSPLMS